jgi:hypothetical protein
MEEVKSINWEVVVWFAVSSMIETHNNALGKGRFMSKQTSHPPMTTALLPDLTFQTTRY